MTITNIYLIDSRLSPKRALDVEVKLFPVDGGKVKLEPAYAIFAALTSTFSSSSPLQLELSLGDWILEFVSSQGNPVAILLRVSNDSNNHEIDAAVIEGYIPPPTARRLHYEPLIKHDEYSDKTARRFSPSSANTPRVEHLRHPRNMGVISKLQVKCETFELRSDIVLMPEHERSFEDCKSFDDKFEYWLDGWHSVDEQNTFNLNLDIIPGKEFCTGRLSLKNSFRRPRKKVLYITFSEERYFFVIPCKVSADLQSDIDVEFDFYDTSEFLNNGRILQVRVFTNDSAFNGVMQQLSKGNLYSAKQLSMRHAERLLQQKYFDPIGAAAGALVLVQPDVSGSVAYLSEHKHVLRWIDNLLDDFEWISEGAICSAWVLAIAGELGIISEAKDEDELRSEIALLLTEAVRRGLPIYTESLNMLSKGVNWAAKEIPVDLHLAVQWLTLHSLNAGPFVLLRDRSEAAS
ncbi:hypothetical protein [Undibacterium crateris]|uniref:hypothetical protein n=1 Tax=Undibacterium crateris TaxID=2528175 RepID=UPI0013893E14|nr:hypothetical protein [Undibacterium crateris]NDI85470.1 hypothetical protein [Undibacterium crateris]